MVMTITPGQPCYGRCYPFSSCKQGGLAGSRGGSAVALMFEEYMEDTRDRGYQQL